MKGEECVASANGYHELSTVDFEMLLEPGNNRRQFPRTLCHWCRKPVTMVTHNQDAFRIVAVPSLPHHFELLRYLWVCHRSGMDHHVGFEENPSEASCVWCKRRLYEYTFSPRRPEGKPYRLYLPDDWRDDWRIEEDP